MTKEHVERFCIYNRIQRSWRVPASPFSHRCTCPTPSRQSPHLLTPEPRWSMGSEAGERTVSRRENLFGAEMVLQFGVRFLSFPSPGRRDGDRFGEERKFSEQTHQVWLRSPQGMQILCSKRLALISAEILTRNTVLTLKRPYFATFQTEEAALMVMHLGARVADEVGEVQAITREPIRRLNFSVNSNESPSFKTAWMYPPRSSDLSDLDHSIQSDRIKPLLIFL